MGLLDVLEAIVSSVARTTANQRADFSRKYERENPNMNDEQRQRLEKFNKQTEKMAALGGTGVKTSTSSCVNNDNLGGKTLSQWDKKWISIGMLKNADLSPYNHCVGIYRHVINGTTKYVGRAVELNNGGFRKRLSDYRRDSDSARRHSSGRIIYEHLDEIETYILVVGNTERDVEITKKLEGQFVRKYRPEWNKMINI